MLSGVASSPIDLNPHNVTIMSRNLYLGGDLGPVLAAVQTGDSSKVAQAVGVLWNDRGGIDKRSPTGPVRLRWRHKG